MPGLADNHEKNGNNTDALRIPILKYLPAGRQVGNYKT